MPRAPGDAGIGAGVGAGAAGGAVAIVRTAPDIIEAVREGGDAAWSVQSIVDAIGLPGIVGGIVVAVVVGYVVYRIVKRSQPAQAEKRPSRFTRLIQRFA